MDRRTRQPSETGAVQGPRRGRIDPQSPSWVAWGLWLLVVLAGVLLTAFLLANDALSTHELTTDLATWLPFLAFPTGGAVILAGRPGTRIGGLGVSLCFPLRVSAWGRSPVGEVLAGTQGPSSAWVLLTQLGTMAWLG